jgi:hypothetical protein
MRSTFRVPVARGGRASLLLVLVFALMAGPVSTRAAQEPPPQQPPPAQEPPQEPAQETPQPSALTFTGDAGLIFNQIKPEHTADFEMVIGRLRDALHKSEDPVRHQQAESWKVFRSAEPAQGGAILYIFVIDPAVKGAEYDPMRILAEVYPTEVQELYEKFKEAYIGLNRVNLQLISDFGGMQPVH